MRTKTIARAGIVVPVAVERQIAAEAARRHPDHPLRAAAFRGGAVRGYVGHEATTAARSEAGQAMEAGQRFGAELAVAPDPFASDLFEMFAAGMRHDAAVAAERRKAEAHLDDLERLCAAGQHPKGAIRRVGWSSNVCGSCGRSVEAWEGA